MPRVIFDVFRSIEQPDLERLPLPGPPPAPYKWVPFWFLIGLVAFILLLGFGLRHAPRFRAALWAVGLWADKALQRFWWTWGIPLFIAFFLAGIIRRRGLATDFWDIFFIGIFACGVAYFLGTIRHAVLHERPTCPKCNNPFVCLPCDFIKETKQGEVAELDKEMKNP